MPLSPPAWTDGKVANTMRTKRASLNILTKPKIGDSARLIAAAAISALTATQVARGGGILFYEFATPDVGLASAGFAARADDASTLFKNPAGMSRLDGVQLQAGVQGLYGSLYFTPDAGTSPR